MSESSQGPGWLQGPNGKWYPPPPPSGPAHQAPAYDRIATPYQPPPYHSGPPYPAAPTRTSGLAIASMVLGILWLYWIGSILALVFGYTARKEIIRDPTVGGRGMATAGIVLGWVGVGFLCLFIVGIALANS